MNEQISGELDGLSQTERHLERVNVRFAETETWQDNKKTTLQSNVSLHST